MTWEVGDHGFTMTLSPRVPDLIAGRKSVTKRARICDNP